MKKILYTIIIGTLVLTAFSCDLETDESKVISRIASFESDLNSGDYDSLKNHFHPTMPSYNSYLDLDVFTSGPLTSGNGPFDFSVPVPTKSGSNFIASGSFSNDFGSTGTYVADLRESGDNWLIYSITITIGTTDYTIKTLK